MATQEPEKESLLLNLPPELRLEIYAFALALDSAHITISTSKLIGRAYKTIQRIYGEGRKPHPGIPHNHEPVIVDHYNATLLTPPSSQNPTPSTINASTTTNDEPTLDHFYNHTPRTALLSTSKQVRAEVQHLLHLSATAPQTHKTTTPTALYVAYPHGLQLLRTLVPHLLHQTHTLHIAGLYTPATFDPNHAAVLPTSSNPSKTPATLTAPTLHDKTFYNAHLLPSHAANLSTLLSQIFGPSPVMYPHLQKLELRTYFPGANAYPTVWGDDESPVCIAMRNIASGSVEVEVCRGGEGTGVLVRVCRGDGGEGRNVSTVWKDLGERWEGWVVDEK